MSLTSQVLLRLIWGCQGKYEACGQEKCLCESLTTTTCLILSPLSVNPVCPCMVYSQVWSTQQGQEGAGELWGQCFCLHWSWGGKWAARHSRAFQSSNVCPLARIAVIALHMRRQCGSLLMAESSRACWYCVSFLSWERGWNAGGWFKDWAVRGLLFFTAHDFLISFPTEHLGTCLEGKWVHISGLSLPRTYSPSTKHVVQCIRHSGPSTKTVTSFLSWACSPQNSSVVCPKVGKRQPPEASTQHERSLRGTRSESGQVLQACLDLDSDHWGLQVPTRITVYFSPRKEKNYLPGIEQGNSGLRSTPWGC